MPSSIASFRNEIGRLQDKNNDISPIYRQTHVIVWPWHNERFIWSRRPVRCIHNIQYACTISVNTSIHKETELSNLYFGGLLDARSRIPHQSSEREMSDDCNDHAPILIFSRTIPRLTFLFSSRFRIVTPTPPPHHRWHILLRVRLTTDASNEYAAIW